MNRVRETTGGPGRKLWLRSGFLAVALFLALASPSFSAVRYVTNTQPNGPGSLKDALDGAESGDVIDATGISGVISPLAVLTVGKDLTVNGPGADQLTVDGGGTQRVFEVLAGVDATITDLSIENGWAVTGGGIYVNPGGALMVQGVHFLNNTALYDGGGLCAEDAALLVEECLFQGNRAAENERGDEGFGGGVYVADSRDLEFYGVTWAQNRADQGGGACFDFCGGAIINSTVSGNTAPRGGGLFLFLSDIDLLFTTITNNESEQGGGVYYLSGASDLEAVIIDGNTGGDHPDWACEFFGEPWSLGYNLIGEPAGCPFSRFTGDITHQSARLEPLADNGGPTPTHALATGSPAIDNGPLVSDLDQDQRGVDRPRNGRADGGPAVWDMGAFELRAHGLTVTVTGDGDGRVVSEPDGIDCGDLCHNGFQVGSTVTLTAEPEPWARFDGFSGDCSGTSACVLHFDSDKTAIAEFSDLSFTIEALAGAGGRINPQGSVSVVGGDDRTFTIEPADGYLIDDVVVDGSSQGAISQYTFQEVSADHAIRATFRSRPAAHHLILAWTLAGGAIDPDGFVQVTEGADQRFAITPDDRFRITDVAVDFQSVGAVDQYTFRQVNEDHVIHARFDHGPRVIVATAGDGGSILPDGRVEVPFAGSQWFFCFPDDGYHLQNVIVDGRSKGVKYIYPFWFVTNDHTIEAVFAPNQPAGYTIGASVSPSDGGRIHPEGNIMVPEGGTQTFNITTQPNYKLVELVVDQTTRPAAEQYTFDQVDQNHTIEAVFVQTHAIDAQAGGGGTIEPQGQVVVLEGENQTFAVDPDDGFSIQDLVVDGESQGPLHRFTFDNVQQSHAIRAEFTPNPPRTYYVYTHAHPVEGGTVSPGGKTPVPKGGSLTVTVSPNDGWEIQDLIEDGEPRGPFTTEVTFNDIDRDHTVTALFQRSPLTVTAYPGLGGSMSPEGDVQVPYGDDRTFAILADDGYHISDVVVDGHSQGPLETYTFYYVRADHSIYPSFRPDPHVISASSAGGGTISPSGAVSVAHGHDQAFTITPAHGYYILDVLVDGRSQGTIGRYTFQNVTADHAIHAEFEENPSPNHVIHAQAEGSGSIFPSGNVEVAPGGDQTFTMTATEGHEIRQVYVDAVPQGPVDTYTFKQVDTNHSILAEFAAESFTISAASGPHGTIDPDGLVQTDYGSDQDFLILPDPGYNIESLLVDGVDVGEKHFHRFQNITEDHAIRAAFVANPPQTFVINAVAAGGGSISPSGDVPVPTGGTADFTISAHPNHRIAAVFVDGRDQGPIDRYTFKDVSANHNIRAEFVANQYTITTIASEGGAILPPGPVEAPEGGDREFWMIPDNGEHVAEVLVDERPMGPLSRYVFKDIGQDHTIEAVFEANPPEAHAILAWSAAGGRVEPSGNVFVADGQDETIRLIPDPGFQVADVLVDGESVGKRQQYTFRNVEANHSLIAEFSLSPEGLARDTGDGGGCFIDSLAGAQWSPLRGPAGRD